MTFTRCTGAIVLGDFCATALSRYILSAAFGKVRHDTSRKVTLVEMVPDYTGQLEVIVVFIMTRQPHRCETGYDVRPSNASKHAADISRLRLNRIDLPVARAN